MDKKKQDAQSNYDAMIKSGQFDDADDLNMEHKVHLIKGVVLTKKFKSHSIHHARS